MASCPAVSPCSVQAFVGHVQKLNFDAALFNQTNSLGFGLVLRDDKGGFLGAKNSQLTGLLHPLLTKALSCREALS